VESSLPNRFSRELREVLRVFLADLTRFVLTLRWIASAKSESEEALPFPPQH
jgi:hypothetical protein